MVRVKAVRAHGAGEDVWVARFFIEQLILKEDMVLMLAGYALWKTDAVNAVKDDVDWSTERIIDEVRTLLRLYGTESKNEGDRADEQAVAWARRQVDKIWPTEK